MWNLWSKLANLLLLAFSCSLRKGDEIQRDTGFSASAESSIDAFNFIRDFFYSIVTTKILMTSPAGGNSISDLVLIRCVVMRMLQNKWARRLSLTRAERRSVARKLQAKFVCLFSIQTDKVWLPFKFFETKRRAKEIKTRLGLLLSNVWKFYADKLRVDVMGRKVKVGHSWSDNDLENQSDIGE